MVDVLTSQQLLYTFLLLLPRRVYICPSRSPFRDHLLALQKAYGTARTLMCRVVLPEAG